MMQQINYPHVTDWPALAQRPQQGNADVEDSVSKILKKVRAKGDKSLYKMALNYDGVQLDELAVSPREIETAKQSVPEELKAAIRQAATHIEIFHNAQREQVNVIETAPGIRCWRQAVAIEKVGLYIPGGSAPLFSTVLMLAIPARIAGCSEIILCTPAGKDGSVHPAILYAADLCGCTRIFKTGGAQAIAAMAYGTESIPPVQKIFGPGNRYVTEAKQQIQKDGVAIDMPAGPSEVLVIADQTANPAFVAADLLSQAEHGPDSQVILLSTDENMAAAVQQELALQLEQLPRMEITALALQNSRSIVLTDTQEAIAFSNLYAPEHLILQTSDAEMLAQQVRSAGSVFIGHYSPESAGDYASGTNHTLPTNGYAAMYSGVSLDSFVKKISFQQLTREGLNWIGHTVQTMAAAEGLDAHKNAVAIRLKN